MKSSREITLELVKNKGYNPYRDASGRFWFGPSRSSRGATGKLRSELKKEGVTFISLLPNSDKIIAKGYGQTILDTYKSIPESMKKMIRSKSKPLSIILMDYPRQKRAGRRYTRGTYNTKRNRVRLFYDTQKPLRTQPKRLRVTLTHELAHAADLQSGITAKDKSSKFFRKYADLSYDTDKNRSNYVSNVKHHVKNFKEFYADTMTSYLTNSPRSRNPLFKRDIVPHLKERGGV